MTQHTKVAGTADGPGLETSHPKFFGLMLGCIGVVYGDIGTSPLYALRELVLAAVGPTAQAGEEVILGILSLIIWALILIVTVKYVMISAPRRQQWRGWNARADGARPSRDRGQ